MRRRHLLQAGAVACALPTRAQSPWPAGPVRFVVPFPAGSAPDVMARLLGARLSEQWGKVGIVDNKPGASGVIGVSALKAAPADAHTFGFVQGSAITTAPATIKGVGYDSAEPRAAHAAGGAGGDGALPRAGRLPAPDDTGGA
jgi:tripartite-type tricarboxylate transporter receptor subunit TctC